MHTRPLPMPRLLLHLLLELFILFLLRQAVLLNFIGRRLLMLSSVQSRDIKMHLLLLINQLFHFRKFVFEVASQAGGA